MHLINLSKTVWNKIIQFSVDSLGAGHWLVAHRNAVEHKYKNTRTKKSEGNSFASNSVVSEWTRVEECGTPDIPGYTLDAPLLVSKEHIWFTTLFHLRENRKPMQ